MEPMIQSTQLLEMPKKKVVGERRFELPTSWSRTKRATRLRYSPNVRMTSNEWHGAGFSCMIKIQDLLINVQIFVRKVG